MSLNKPEWYFKDWLDNLNEEELSANPHPAAIKYLEDNPELIRWFPFSKNPSAIDILAKNLDKIVWYSFNANPTAKAIEILKANPDKINWFILSKNPAAVQFLAENRDKINKESLFQNPGAMSLIRKMRPKRWNSKYIYFLSGNHSAEAIRIVKANFKLLKTEFGLLVQNPFAADLIIEHFDKLKIDYLALLGYNTNPRIISLIKEKELSHLMIYYIPSNPAPEAFKLIEENMHLYTKNNNFAMRRLWCNPNIFQYDYKKMKNAKCQIYQELTDFIMNPDWIPQKEGLKYLKCLFDD